MLYVARQCLKATMRNTKLWKNLTYHPFNNKIPTTILEPGEILPADKMWSKYFHACTITLCKY